VSRHAPGPSGQTRPHSRATGETNGSKIGVEIVVMNKLARRYQRDNYFLRRFMRLAFASSEDAIIVTRDPTISACAQAELSATDQLPHAL
jgi:hypothetical protein